jgi:hypothetical protein
LGQVTGFCTPLTTTGNKPNNLQDSFLVLKLGKRLLLNLQD